MIIKRIKMDLQLGDILELKNIQNKLSYTYKIIKKSSYIEDNVYYYDYELVRL